MNTAQNKAIYALLNKTGLMAQKENLALGISNGRTTHSNELTTGEAIEFIKWLKTQDPDEKKAEVMRRKIIAMAHRLGWENANGKVNLQQLDKWMTEKSYLKKSLNQYLYHELPKLVSQFKMMYEYYINKTTN